MKKIYIITFSLILITFILITILKHQSSQNIEKKDPGRHLTVEKEKMHLFWKIYRKANQQRIAGKLDSAATGYKNALLYDDKHEDALYYLGNVCIDLGEHENAERYWKKLIKINPKSARAYFQLGNLYLNYIDENYFNINKAAECFKQVLKINNEESGSIYLVGQIELIRGNYSKAHQIFEAVSGSNYNNLDASFFYSYIDWKMGNTDLAISGLTRAVKQANTPQTDEIFSSEGDTKLGKPLYNSIISQRKSLFYDYIIGLREMSGPITKRNFETRFKRLDEFLIQLRAKI
jgi:tetratricopeptide (TPR) repeat protein